MGTVQFLGVYTANWFWEFGNISIINFDRSLQSQQYFRTVTVLPYSCTDQLMQSICDFYSAFFHIFWLSWEEDSMMMSESKMVKLFFAHAINFERKKIAGMTLGLKIKAILMEFVIETLAQYFIRMFDQNMEKKVGFQLIALCLICHKNIKFMNKVLLINLKLFTPTPSPKIYYFSNAKTIKFSKLIIFCHKTLGKQVYCYLKQLQITFNSKHFLKICDFCKAFKSHDLQQFKDFTTDIIAV